MSRSTTVVPPQQLTAPMQKVILRIQIFEVLETLARLESWIVEGLETSPRREKLWRLAQKKVGELQARLNQKYEQLSVCLQESPEFDLTRPSLNALHEVLEQCRTEAERLADTLWAMEPQGTEDSLYQTLNELAPLSLLGDNKERVVTAQCTGQTASSVSLSEALFECLPVLSMQDPLKWVGLTRQYCMQLYLNHPDKWVVAPLNRAAALKRTDDSTEPLLRRLVPHLLGLRLLGPAYYAFVITEALCQRQTKFLTQIEPVLFFGLNFFNCTNNAVVILHEAVERASSWLTPVTRPLAEQAGQAAAKALQPGGTEAAEEKDPDSDEPGLAFKLAEPMASWIPSLLKEVEATIPERLAFGPRRHQQAQELVKRLRVGLPIAASSPFSLDAQQESLKNLLHASDSLHSDSAHPRLTQEQLYQALQRTAEVPHTASEILNAGWLYRLEALSGWLSSSLPPAASVNGNGRSFTAGSLQLAELNATLSQLDNVLKSSIETAQVQRFLMASDQLGPLA